MAHEIMGKRFISRVKPAWHGIGETFEAETAISASEAVAKVAGDISIIDVPVWIEKPGSDTLANMYTRLGNYKAIIREGTADDPDFKVMGVTTEKWQRVDFNELAKALDPLSKTYQVETCGLIFDGAVCFIAFKGPDFAVSGDKMQDYFLAELSMKPGRSHSVLASPVRAVCNNTCRMAETSSSIALKIPHSKAQTDRIGWAADIVSKFKEMTTKNREMFEQFAKTRITDENLDELLQAAWPSPPKPTEVKLLETIMTSQEEGAIKSAMGVRFDQIIKAQHEHENRCKRVMKLRDAGRESFANFDPSNLRGTVWAGYNAVTEVADWREGAGAETSSMWGSRAQEKTRAFVHCLKLADIS